MAKQRQQFSGEQAFNAIVNMCKTQIDVEAKQADNPEEYKHQMTSMLNVITKSNLRTSAQLNDDAIEAYHQMNDQAELQAAEQQMLAAQDTIARLTAGRQV